MLAGFPAPDIFNLKWASGAVTSSIMRLLLRCCEADASSVTGQGTWLEALRQTELFIKF